MLALPQHACIQWASAAPAPYGIKPPFPYIPVDHKRLDALMQAVAAAEPRVGEKVPAGQGVGFTEERGQ